VIELIKIYKNMPERKFKIAIAGCGKVAHLHAKAIKNIDNAELSGVWSRSTKSAIDFAILYNTRPYSDVGKMVRDNNIDLVVICTPHPFHKEPAVEAATAGSSVLVEKPLASSLYDCDAIIDTCKENNVSLGVISQRRWYSPVKRMKEAIDSGRIGKPALASVTMLGWRDKAYYDSDAWRGKWDTEGGGVLVNQSPHQLDLMLWFMGDVEEIYGIWRNMNHPYIEVEDTAVAIIKFKSGAVGNILVSNSMKPGIYGKVHVHGDNGASVGVQTDGGAMFIAGMTGVAEPPVNDIWTIPGEEDMLEHWKSEDTEIFNRYDPTIYYMQLQIEDFINSLRNGSEPLVTGLAGRKTVELFSGIYRSTLENGPVRFPLNPEPGYDGRKLTF
jgi:UDP-N-acetyl-2-amino-2-deoxyglucuronate dehydrogenase